MENNNPNMNFKPTTQWMAARYDEMNLKLFGGCLGECDFGIFTSGKGAEGRTLGYFTMQARGLQYIKSTRKMIINGQPIVNRNNFYRTCSPVIKINGNYSGEESAFLNTLVHEMCHYYTYMDGFVPKQAHGREFKNIAASVAYRSNGEITIERLATAEDMSKLQLSDEMKAKADERVKRKKSSMTAIFRFMKNGEIQLTNTSSKGLIDLVVRSSQQGGVAKVVTSNDQNLIDILYQKGYKKSMRTWRYWAIRDMSFIGDLNSYDVIVYENNTFDENKMRNTKDIIKEVIEEFIGNERMNGDVCDISPNMNLGLSSPIENEQSEDF